VPSAAGRAGDRTDRRARERPVPAGVPDPHRAAAAAAVSARRRGCRVCARLDGRNVASARVLERAGLRREAHLVENEFIKGEWTDEMVYAILRREWEARRAAG
jgi:hypothetical protein